MPRRAIVVDSSDGDSDDSDSSSSQVSNQLIDDEAADSEDFGDGSSSIDVPLSEQFHQFMKLPIEIRREIWDIVFPDAVTKQPRVLQLATLARPPGSSGEAGSGWAFCEDLATPDQTEQLRNLASIHKETRDIVLKAFPDVITLHPGKAQLHFNSDRDIVVTNVNHEIGEHMRDNKLRFSNNHVGRHDAIKHICFNWKQRFPAQIHEEGDFRMIQSIVRDLPNVETIMYAIEAEPGDELKRSKQWGWIAEEQTVEARVKTYQKSFGLGEDLEWAYIWPDFKNHPYFLNQIPGLANIQIPQEYTQLILDKGARYVPMVIFDYNNLRYLDRLKKRNENRPWNTIDWDQDTSNHESDSEDDESDDDINNDYESEGLDDEDIEQWDDHDEDEMIPPPVSPLGGPISVSSDEDAEPPDLMVHSPAPGNFSSPEPDADEHQAGPAVHSSGGGNFSSPESETEEEDVGPRRPKRRIVSDSDDEDDDEPPAKRTKRSIVAESSDEEGDQIRQVQQSTSRGAPQLISDDEDEKPRQRQRSGSRGAPQVISDDEEEISAESSSEEDEDDAPPKKLSLAQRLRATPAVGPAVTDNQDSDDADSFCSYADGEDDEEDEDSENDDDPVHRMAVDTDDDDGGESDDGW